MDLDNDEAAALSLYVLASRDIGDFIEELDGASNRALGLLYAMLTPENQTSPKTDTELKRIAETYVRRHLKERGIFETWEANVERARDQ